MKPNFGFEFKEKLKTKLKSRIQIKIWKPSFEFEFEQEFKNQASNATSNKKSNSEAKFWIQIQTIISELHKGVKRLQCSSNFMNKIEERSNTAFFQPNRLPDWCPGKLFFKKARLHEL